MSYTCFLSFVSMLLMRALSRASAGRLCPRRLRLGARGFSADVSAAPTASAPQITHEELRDVARTFVEQEINPHVLTSGRRPASSRRMSSSQSSATPACWA